MTAGSLVVILDIGESLIAARRPLKRAALFARAPRDEVLDLASEFEVLVGDSLRAVVLQFHLNPGVGRGNIRMMPGGLRKMADGVDHHQRALPAGGAKSPSDPAVFVPPMRKLAFETRVDLVRFIDALFGLFAHGVPPIPFTRRAPIARSLHQRAAALIERPEGSVGRNCFDEIIDVKPALRLLWR